MALWYPVFLFSTTLHEFAHAYMAKRGGDDTAYEGGQVSLNPVPHLQREPFGMVVVPIVSFLLGGWMIGWASTPFDPAWAERHPKRAAWMSLAGPIANLLLVVLAALAIRAGVAAEVFWAPSSITFSRVTAATQPQLEVVAQVLSITFTLNLILFVLNLMPIPPLDGSGAMPLVLKGRALEHYNALRAQPAMALLGLIVLWNVFGYVFSPIHVAALNLLYPGMGYG